MGSTLFRHCFLEDVSAHLGFGVHHIQARRSSSCSFVRDIVEVSMPPNLERHL